MRPRADHQRRLGLIRSLGDLGGCRARSRRKGNAGQDQQKRAPVAQKMARKGAKAAVGVASAGLEAASTAAPSAARGVAAAAAPGAAASAEKRPRGMNTTCGELAVNGGSRYVDAVLVRGEDAPCK